jgi:DNA-binding MarR family transcriptional regulator
MDTFLGLEAVFKFLDGQLTKVLGMSYTDYLILKELAYAETTQTPTLLAKAVNKVPTSFTPILDKLQDKNLLKRSPNKGDRRSVNIKPVNKVKLAKLIAELEPKVEAVLEKYVLPEERALIDAMYSRLHPVD